MVFVFDLDDTVCETDAYSEKYINNFFKKYNLPFYQVKNNTRFAEEKFSWDERVALSWYKIFGDEMLLSIPCKKNAVRFINSLYNAGHKIIFATARSTDWHTNPERATKQWLAKNGIKYNKLYMSRTDKEKICNEEKADFFIDDDIQITQKVANDVLSCKTFLMTSKYNKEFKTSESVTRIRDFDELKNQLKLNLTELIK